MGWLLKIHTAMGGGIISDCKGFQAYKRVQVEVKSIYNTFRS